MFWISDYNEFRSSLLLTWRIGNSPFSEIRRGCGIGVDRGLRTGNGQFHNHPRGSSLWRFFPEPPLHTGLFVHNRTIVRHEASLDFDYLFAGDEFNGAIDTPPYSDTSVSVGRRCSILNPQIGLNPSIRQRNGVYCQRKSAVP